MDNNKKPTATKREKIATIVGIILCVILIPILIINVTMIIDSFVHKDEVPGFFGLTPLIVETDSMKGKFDGGDMIICKDIDPEDVENEDIIAFYDPMNTAKKVVVTHRVKEIIKDEDGNLVAFRTKGDANNSMDFKPVPKENVVGVYVTHIPNMGTVLLFMQSTLGLVVCIGVPLILLVSYELYRRFVYEKGNKSDMDKMREELEALRAEKERLEAQKETAQQPPAEDSPAPSEQDTQE